MVTRKTYTYNVSREDRWWLIHVPELDGISQARFLGEIDLMVRDLISVWIEQPTESFDVKLGKFELPGTVDDHLNAAMTSWLEADLEAGRAAEELRDSEVGIRDIGRILRVSYVIARKLLANADGVDTCLRAMIAVDPADPSKPRHTDAEIEEAADVVDTLAVRWRPLMARPGMADGAVATGARPSPTIEDVESSWVEAVGPFYDAAAVAGVLGVSVSAVRGRRARGSLLALRTGSGKVVYPAWQFDDGGQVLPGLVPVLRVLGGSDANAWTLASWLRSPEAELSGRTPLAVLHIGAEDELVLLVASHAAAGWERRDTAELERRFMANPDLQTRIANASDHPDEQRPRRPRTVDDDVDR
jgi:hypothetical protein